MTWNINFILTSVNEMQLLGVVHHFRPSTMHDGVRWDRRVGGFSFGDVSKEPRRQEGRMRGSSLVQVGRNEESELLWKGGMMEWALANGQYKDSQLPATLGPFNGGRQRHGDVYALLQSNYASQAHIKHSPWSPTGIGRLHQQKAQEQANLHFEAQLLFLPMHRFNNDISQHDVTLVKIHLFFSRLNPVIKLQKNGEEEKMFFGLLEIVCQLRYIDMRKHRSLSQTCSRILRLMGLVRLDGSSRVWPHRLDQSWSARGGKNTGELRRIYIPEIRKLIVLDEEQALRDATFVWLPWNFLGILCTLMTEVRLMRA